MKEEGFTSAINTIDKELHALQDQMEIAYRNFKEFEQAYQDKQLEKIEFLSDSIKHLYNLNPNNYDR